MARKPSKIIFCKFNAPFVDEIAEYYNNKLVEAQWAEKLHNDFLKQNLNTELENQFYFLNATIKGEITIITTAGQRDYPMNDPQIVAKLQNYLESKEVRKPGSAHKRGPHKSNPNYGESQT